MRNPPKEPHNMGERPNPNPTNPAQVKAGATPSEKQKDPATAATEKAGGTAPPPAGTAPPPSPGQIGKMEGAVPQPNPTTTNPGPGKASQNDMQ